MARYVPFDGLMVEGAIAISSLVLTEVDACEPFLLFSKARDDNLIRGPARIAGVHNCSGLRGRTGRPS